MGSAVDRTFSSGEGIDKLKERLKLVDIGDIVGKANMHAAEAYSHAKEAYRQRDEFFKLMEDHAFAYLDSRTKEKLSRAAASLNAALGVADAAVSMANSAARAANSAKGNTSLDHSSSEPISKPYESSSVMRDEKEATYMDCGETPQVTKDVALIKAVSDDTVTSASIAASAANSEQAKPAARTESTTKLDSREKSPHREAVAGDKKILSREEEVKLEEEGCEKETSSLEKMAHLEAVREGLARVRDDPALEEVADADIAANPDQDNPALLPATTESTSLVERLGEEEERRSLEEECKKKKLEEEGKRRDNKRNQKRTKPKKKKDLLCEEEEERRRLEAQLKAKADAALEEVVVADIDADSDQGNPDLLAAKTESRNLDSSERSLQREAVRAALARDKKILLREEEIRLVEEGCDKETSLERMARIVALRESFARGHEDTAPEAVAAADSDQGNPALLAEKTASTDLDAGERSVQGEALAGDKKSERMAKMVALREALARVRDDAALEKVEDAPVTAADNIAASASDSASFFSSLTQIASRSLDADEKRAPPVREGLARDKQDLLREEESRRLEAEMKAKKECKKKKREEESKMRDDKRKQKMDKNTKNPKDKGKGKK